MFPMFTAEIIDRKKREQRQRIIPFQLGAEGISRVHSAFDSLVLCCWFILEVFRKSFELLDHLYRLEIVVEPFQRLGQALVYPVDIGTRRRHNCYEEFRIHMPYEADWKHLRRHSIFLDGQSSKFHLWECRM